MNNRRYNEYDIYSKFDGMDSRDRDEMASRAIEYRDDSLSPITVHSDDDQRFFDNNKPIAPAKSQVGYGAYGAISAPKAPVITIKLENKNLNSNKEVGSYQQQKDQEVQQYSHQKDDKYSDDPYYSNKDSQYKSSSYAKESGRYGSKDSQYKETARDSSGYSSKDTQQQHYSKESRYSKDRYSSKDSHYDKDYDYDKESPRYSKERSSSYRHQDKYKDDRTSYRHQDKYKNDSSRKSQDKSHDKNHHSDPSAATTERLGRLESMLEELVKKNIPTTPTPPQASATDKDKSAVADKDNDITFYLDPRKHSFTTSMWINKIQEMSVLNSWNEKSTVQYMETQMSGIIKAWYNSLPSYEFTWPEWKLLITKTFPDNIDFVISLKRLVTRLKQPDETMHNYYFSKMYLLEACKISGEDAVSCLIDGLNNQIIQTQAKSQNFLTPETLYAQFLLNLPDYNVDYEPPYTSENSGPINTWYQPGPEPRPEPPRERPHMPNYPPSQDREVQIVRERVEQPPLDYEEEDYEMNDRGLDPRDMMMEPHFDQLHPQPPQMRKPVHARREPRDRSSSSATDGHTHKRCCIHGSKVQTKNYDAGPQPLMRTAVAPPRPQSPPPPRPSPIRREKQRSDRAYVDSQQQQKQNQPTMAERYVEEQRLEEKRLEQQNQQRQPSERSSSPCLVIDLGVSPDSPFFGEDETEEPPENNNTVTGSTRTGMTTEEQPRHQQKQRSQRGDRVRRILRKTSPLRKERNGRGRPPPRKSSPLPKQHGGGGDTTAARYLSDPGGRCWRCGQLGHSREKCPPQNTKMRFCSRCGKVDVLSKDCSCPPRAGTKRKLAEVTP